MAMAMVTQLRREPAMDFRAALLTESLKVTQPVPPRMISVKLLEKRTSRVGLMAAPPVDLPLRPVVHALRNFDLRLKLVSESRLIAAKPMARTTRPPRHPE